jgi:SAM-dependent methyltransferase
MSKRPYSRRRLSFDTTLWWFAAFGLHLREAWHALRALPSFVRDFKLLAAQNRESAKPWKVLLNRPCLLDRSGESGTAKGHYFHQDLLVARKIAQRNPERHVDVGSRIDGFVAHVAVFRHIEVFDIRPLDLQIRNITFRQCDLMNLPDSLVGYCDSISSLHVVEHFGLGRYGDRVDINGYAIGFENLYRILRPGGVMYLSVPIGDERIEFNGHRVFGLPTLVDLFVRRFDILSFSYVDDGGDLYEDIVLTPAMIEVTLGLRYGCGIFEMRKL